VATKKEGDSVEGNADLLPPAPSSRADAAVGEAQEDGEREEHAAAASAPPAAPAATTPAPPSTDATRLTAPAEPAVLADELPAHAPGWFRSFLATIPNTFRSWFRDPDFSIWFVAYMLLSAALFMRPWWGSAATSMGGGWVFDEQEAIVANPYIRSAKFGWMDALRRDFWGLPPDHSIGSYRPIPNFLWRGLWKIQITDRRFIAGWAVGIIGALALLFGLYALGRSLYDDLTDKRAKKGPSASLVDRLTVPAIGIVLQAVGFWLVRGSAGPAEIAGTSPSNVAFVWFNVVFHATNAAILASLVRAVTKRVALAWLAGFVFCTCAVLTEAITGVVGIADVLGGLSLLLALYALVLHPAAVAPAVFLATAFGLLSKETAVVNVGLVPLAALLLAPSIDEKRPYRITRTAAAFVGALAALGFYFWVRHKYFFVDLAIDEKVAGKWHGLGKYAAKLRHWVGAPDLPADPFNNPLADPNATDGQRIGGALRVYARGLWQVVFPRTLSPDYSSPQEPLPAKPWFAESIAGAALMVGPPLVGAWLALKSWRGEASAKAKASYAELRLVAFGLLAWPAAFFPVSNIPKVLPTVRAERFWYTPAIATTLVIAFVLVWLSRRRWEAGVLAAIAFVTMQAGYARKHANDFRDDLAFWRSAALAVPNSAKAHLNYSVMLGARAAELWKYTAQQAQEARLAENIRATELAPHWDMAFIYVGDTLCQLNRFDEAWDWYAKGFRIGPANTGLIALALQCMSDHNQLLPKETEARALANEEAMRGSWYAYLVDETYGRERKCRGVDVEPGDYEDDEELNKLLLAPDSSDGVARTPEAASGSASGSGSVAGSVSGAVSAKGSASTSTSPSPSASTSASAGTSASASGSEASIHPAPTPKVKKPRPAPTNTDCGVAPKWRPRGLDQGPQE
jgi:tetratricopeptide (TPR) repeat protein